MAVAGSPFADEGGVDAFATDLIFEICERRGVTPSLPLGQALYAVIVEILFLDGIAVTFTGIENTAALTIEEGVELRALAQRAIRFHADRERLLAIWREKVVRVFAGMLEYFPASAFTDIDEDGTAIDDSIVLPEARAYDLCDNVPEVVERLIMTFVDEDVTNARLFGALRERFNNNALAASGFRQGQDADVRGKLILPTKQKDKSAGFVVDAYLSGTPFQAFFRAGLPFAIPFPARFEHTHIVGGSGHGKTQLIQFMLNHDLVRAREDGRAIVIMDSQGDLLNTVRRLAYFSPGAEKSLADRFVFIDPNDIEHPACLNMFDFNRDRLSGYAAVDREKILNATVELYEYFFSALLGAELTQRQGVIFRYLARLLIEIPDATIHTLRELMEDGEPFRPYMEKLPGTAGHFFATRFFDRQFNETKKQILTRLWGVLSNSTLERMFSHPKSKLDLFDLLNGGKIILINTAKDLLGQEGTAIFGRFFIALIVQAAVQRAALAPHERNPAFVYIDEAQDYFDENIAHILNQARKYKVGLIFAHQNLEQLRGGLMQSVLANTSIKFVGGVSARDAHTLDAELRTTSDFLVGRKRERAHTEFACHVRNYTRSALSVQVPLGHVERLPRLSAEEEGVLLGANRARYTGIPVFPSFRERPPAKKESPQVESPPSPPVAPPKSSDVVAPKLLPTRTRRPEVASTGRGGQQHKYLQHLVRQLAQEHGFLVVVEQPVLDGTGCVDVSLSRGDRRIAVEISVTTNRDQELGNVEKCLAADYTDILLLAANERHSKTLQKFIESHLEESIRGKVQYLPPEGLPVYFERFRDAPVTREETVRGYKVKTVQQAGDPSEALARRRAVAEVVARSLKRTSD